MIFNIYQIVIFITGVLIYIFFEYRSWQKKQAKNIEPQKPRIIDEHWDLLDMSCSCHTGHPPCSYCVDTFNCEQCGERAYANTSEMLENGKFVCIDCHEEVCYRLTRKENLIVYGMMAISLLLFIAMCVFIYLKVFK